LRRIVSSWRGWLSRKSTLVVIDSISFSISGMDMPLAYAPPTSAPMLVPVMQSTGTRSYVKHVRQTRTYKKRQSSDTSPGESLF